MWHKKKIYLIAMVAVLVLIAGSIGGVALAQETEETTDNTTPAQTLISRVASILGIEQETLENAISQAKQEMREEAQDEYLQGLVDNGQLTQEEADQYKAWLEAKPDVNIHRDMSGLRGSGFPGTFQRGAIRGFGDFGSQSWCQPSQSQETANTTSY
jgi:uncharacterized membrane protein